MWQSSHPQSSTRADSGNWFGGGEGEEMFIDPYQPLGEMTPYPAPNAPSVLDSLQNTRYGLQVEF